MKKIVFAAVLFIGVSCHDRSFEKAVQAETGEYKLEQVVVLSRHNIRSPFIAPGSVLDSVTTKSAFWHKWESAPGELTPKGGVSELLLGQYFKLWLESEGLIPANWQPRRKEAFFYANCVQRTVSTARHFATGMIPTAKIRIKYKPNSTDLSFLPILSADSEAFQTEALKEAALVAGGLEIQRDSLQKAFDLLEPLLDFEGSEYFKKHGEHFSYEAPDISYVKGSEPRIRGMFKLALSTCDALVLQSYEEENLESAALGGKLGEEEWGRIGGLVSLYEDILFSPPVVCSNTSLGTMKLLFRELGKPGRKFSFLCGHDSTIANSLSALGVEPYTLEGTLEKKTPIGGKLLLERYSRGEEQFVKLRLVYPGWEQLRELTAFSLDNPPRSCVLSLKGLEALPGGYYPIARVRARMKESMAAGRRARRI